MEFQFPSAYSFLKLLPIITFVEHFRTTSGSRTRIGKHISTLDFHTLDTLLERDGNIELNRPIVRETPNDHVFVPRFHRE